MNLTVKEWIEANLCGLRELYLRGDNEAIDAVLEVWRLEREIL